MQPTSHAFKANTHGALGDAHLQQALKLMRAGFPGRRAAAIARLP
jgi:L-lactate dehydrogenase complex protein LldF